MNRRAYRNYIPEGYLTSNDYAIKYGITYGQVQYLLSLGKIPCIRIGRVRVLEDVEPMVKKGRCYDVNRKIAENQ